MNADQFILGDVRQVLACCASDSADLAIADPGYGMGKGDWDLRPDSGRWIEEAMRVLKPSGTAYVFGLPEAVAASWNAFPSPKRLLTWHVTNRVSPACKTWQPTSESIVMLTKGHPYFDRDAVREPYGAAYEHLKGRPRARTPSRFGSRATRYSDAPGALPRDVLRGPGLSGRVGARESLGHPCQKPLWLMEKLVKASCPPGGLCLDLFSGVATASVAAYGLGRRWLAVENDPKWCEVGLDRLRNAGARASIVAVPAQENAAWRAKVEEELACLREMVIGMHAGALGHQVKDV